MSGRFESVPDELKERDQWLLWDANADTPRQPHWRGDFGISYPDPDDWHSFDEAVNAAGERESWGIGYVMAWANPDVPTGLYACIDVDKGLTGDGDLKDWVPKLDLFKDAETYIERSASGEGLHIPVFGQLLPSWWKNGQIGDHEGVDVLRNRFCAFTGDAIESSGIEVADVDPTEWLFDAYRSIHGENPRIKPSDGGETDDYDGDEWLTEDHVREALSHVDPDVGYSTWRDIGFAVHDFDSGATGRQLFEQWSRRGSKWDDQAERYIEAIWDSASPGDGVTVATLIHYAKQGGWSTPSSSSRGEAAADGGATAAQPTQTTDKVENDDPTASDVYDVLGVDPKETDLGQIPNHQLANGIELALSARNDIHIRVLDNVDSKDQELYAMDPDTKVWEPKGQQRLGQISRGILGIHNSKNVQNELTNALRSNPEGYWLIDRDELGAPAGELPVKNGLLELETLDRREPEPSDYLLGRMPTEYDPGASIDGTRFEKFLMQAVSPADLEKLQEYAGYCLLHNRQPYKKALFLFGPTDSGKGTFIDLLETVLGSDNVSGESLDNLLDSRWGYHSIYGAWVNVSNELTPGSISNIEKFKTLIGSEDKVTAEDKGVSKYEFTVTQKFVFATNQFPEVEDADEAFYNRCLFVEFPNSVSEEDKDETLPEQLREERSAVLNWMLEGLKRLKENGGVFTNERSTDEKKDITRAFGSPVDQFAYRAIEVTNDPEHVVAKKDLYAAFTRFCDYIDKDTATQRSFTKRLKEEAGIQDGKSRRVHNEGNLTDVFKGLMLNEELFKKIQADLPRHSYETGGSDGSQKTL